MLMSLALKSLTYDWRRFLPAVVAVGFSGLLVLLQAAIILGIFSLSSIYVTRSSADLWVGYPGVQSIDLGRPIAAQAELFLRMDPRVDQVEPFLWGSGQWRTPHRGMVNVYIVGVDAQPGAMALADALTPELRAQLMAPNTVLVDRADLAKLEIAVGDTAEINGRQVQVIGLTDGMRGLGGVNVIASIATTRRLDPAAGPGDDVAYYLARTRTPAEAAAAAADLRQTGARRGFEALTAGDFANRTTRYWLMESGAGVAFIFGAVVAILVAVIITSQTLLAAVSASIKEYAALRALGFSMPSLRAIVLAQSFWVGAVGVAAAGVLTVALAGVAHLQGVPIVLSAPMMIVAGGLILVVALLSGLVALRRVAQADPVMLLL
jgi:putative ABC transport system permease protein